MRALPSTSSLWDRVRSLPRPRFSAPTWRRGPPKPAAVPGAMHRSPPVARALEGIANLTELELRAVVGRGTFGVVRLAVHRASGAIVAVKILDKRRGAVLGLVRGAAADEAAAHAALRHPFIARLFAQLEDDVAVYLVMEFCPGGELYALVYGGAAHVEEDESEDEADDVLSNVGSFPPSSSVKPMDMDTSEDEADSVLSNVGAFKTVKPMDMDTSELSDDVTSSESEDDDRHMRRASRVHGRASLSLANLLAKQTLRVGMQCTSVGLREPVAAFYLACLASAMQHIHARGVLYRDLKLENLVLDARGYPKLIDFGQCKPRGYTSETMCGSREYMAPEVVARRGADHRADIWAFGVVMFELLVGRTPFHHENARELGRRVLEDAVELPAELSRDARDLLRTLLAKEAAARPQSFDDVRRAAFFRRYFADDDAWTKLLERKTPAPFVPQLAGESDTALFDVHEVDEDEW